MAEKLSGHRGVRHKLSESWPTWLRTLRAVHSSILFNWIVGSVAEPRVIQSSLCVCKRRAPVEKSTGQTSLWQNSMIERKSMIKLLKQYVEELKRANDLKERELNFMLDPYYQHINKQQVTVKVPQLDKIELQAPNTSNPNWTVST